MMESHQGAKMCPECSESCGVEAQFCWHCGFPVGAVSRTEHDPLLGRELPGGYHVLELIGVGGMGRVYRAQQRALGRTVAIKVIHPHLLAEEKSLARFLTEARATSQLNHPNTVSVIDFGQTSEGQPYLVMEFLRGKNLAQVVSIEGLLSLRRLLGVLHQVLLALGEAHALDIIHRDLKPENIIIEPMRRGGDFVKVVDFGLAKLKADELQGTGITMPGIVCGTPDFMAPEQGRGDPIDGRSDLYAVGVVMFWLLCGRLPFEANTPTQVVMMHITMAVPDPREIAPQREMPEPVLAVLHRALSKDPRDRFPDAHSFADAVFDLMQMLERNSWRPSPTGLAAANVPLLSVTCSRCTQLVPWGRFCLACGDELPAVPDSAAPGSPAPLPFVGREEELRWLSETALRVSFEFVFARLIGDNGVGKTRLLEEFQRRHPEYRVVNARPDPFWAEIPGHTLQELVEGLLGDLDRAAVHAAGRDPCSLVLRELLYGEAADSLDPDTRRRAYRDALLWSIQRANERGQGLLLLFVDDLDHIDGVSRQALTDLWDNPEGLSVGVVATHSHRFNPAWLRDRDDPDGLRVLVGLPNAVGAQLLSTALKGHLEIALANTGAGAVSPLYLEQVVRFTMDGGTDPPPRLADLIAQRVTSLVGHQRACVQALATLGDRVSKRLLASFSSIDDAQREPWDQAIEELMASGFVRRNADATLSLVHPIFHDVVLLTTPAEARRELHRRAAEVFRSEGAPVEVLAEHAFLGQDTMAALVTLEQAATRASARGDAETATHLLQRGLDLARLEIHRGELEDPLAAVVIFGRKLGETLQMRGKLSDARGVLQEVLGATAPRGTDRAEVLAQLAEVAQHCNQWPEAERLLERALTAARDAKAGEGLMLGLQLRLESIRTMPAKATV